MTYIRTSFIVNKQQFYNHLVSDILYLKLFSYPFNILNYFYFCLVSDILYQFNSFYIHLVSIHLILNSFISVQCSTYCIFELFYIHSVSYILYLQLFISVQCLTYCIFNSFISVQCLTYCILNSFISVQCPTLWRRETEDVDSKAPYTQINFRPGFSRL